MVTSRTHKSVNKGENYNLMARKNVYQQRRFRLLFVNSTSEIGGADLDLLQICSNLDRNRFEPIVVLPGPSSIAREFEALGIEVIFMRLGAIKRTVRPIDWILFVVYSVSSILGLIRLSKNRNIDLIHINSIVLPAVAIASRLAGVRCVWHIREIVTRPIWLRNILGVLVSLLAHRVVAISNAIKLMFPKWVARRIVVIHHGVDLRAFDLAINSSKMRLELGIPESTFVVGFIGRIAPLKGVEYLIRAVGQLSKETPDVCLLIVGPTFQRYRGYAESLAELVTSLQLEHCARILPARRDIPYVLSAIDVLALPSVHPEGFGLVLIEAMAMGKSVIGTALGGVPEIVDREPPVGFIVPPRDANAIAITLSHLASNRQLGREMGRHARDCVEREFDIRTVIQKLQKLYLELLEGR